MDRKYLKFSSFGTIGESAYFHFAPSPAGFIFIPRILLRRLKNEEGTERKCNFEKIL
jgi:hypothetical protein